MSFLYSFLLLLIAFFLQSSFLGSFRIFGLTPNLILMLLILFSIYDSKNRQIFYAIFFGFLMDLTISLTFGIHLIFFVLIVFLARMVSKGAGVSTPLPVVLGLLILGSLSYAIIQSVFFLFNGGTLSFGLIKISFIQVILDSFLGFLLFAFAGKYFELMKVMDVKFEQKVRR